jgi:hypothetical protein
MSVLSRQHLCRFFLSRNATTSIDDDTCVILHLSPPKKNKAACLPACRWKKQRNKESKLASKRVRKREEEVSLRRKGVLGFWFVLACSCSPFKCQTKHNTNITLKPYITAFSGGFFLKLKLIN